MTKKPTFFIIAPNWPASEFQVEYLASIDIDGNETWLTKKVTLSDEVIARLVKGEHKGHGISVDKEGNVRLNEDVAEE